MSWPEVDFECLFEVPSRNGVYKSKDHHGSGVPIVNMGELFAFNRIGNQPMSLIRMSDAEMDKSGLIDGDLLFGRRSLVEEGAGKCSMVYKPAGPLTFESSMIRVRLDRAVADPEFFFNYFRSPIGRSRIRAIVGGAAVKGIRGSDLKLIKVHMPPLDQQIAIRQIVALYDDLIATNQRRIALLEDAARRLYREWFVHLRFPGHESVTVKDGVPQGWAIRNLFDVCDVDYGFPFKADQFNTDGIGMPAIRIRDIPDVSTSTYTAEEVDISYIVKRGDFLIGMDGIFHMNFWVGEDALLVQRVCRIRPKLESLRAYIGLALHAPIKAFEATIQGATVAHLGAKHLKSIDLLVPAAMDEQLDYLNRALWQQIQLREMNRRLAHARDLLLPKLMSGQLDISGIAVPDGVAA